MKLIAITLQYSLTEERVVAPHWIKQTSKKNIKPLVKKKKQFIRCI